MGDYRPTVSPIFRPLYDSRKLFTVLYGGRGGGKSYAVAMWTIWEGRLSRHKFLCARQYQVSIGKSVYPLLEDVVRTHGVADEFKFTDNRIRHLATGSEWIFEGLERNAESVRSTHGLSCVWIEEAHAVGRAPWEILKPTPRREGFRIVCVLNPTHDDDPVYSDLVLADEYADETTRIEVNWRDNPFMSESLHKLRRIEEKGDPDVYANVWEGKLRKHSSAQVFKPGEWDVDEPEIPNDAAAYVGLDVGMTSSPSAAIACWHWWDGERHHVHVAGERYGMGLTQANLEAWLDGVHLGGEKTVSCDHQVLTTGDLRLSGGWRVRHATKRAGSVAQGVRWLKGCVLTASPKCPNTARELRDYSYKVDKMSEEVLDEFALRQSDHAIDALRYALEPVMVARRASRGAYAGFKGTVS